MVPVNLRTAGDADGGNVVSAALCSLATDEVDPARRLERIQKSMRENKKELSQLPRAQAMALAAATVIAPAALASLPGFNASTPPTFNVCISNVPGMREPLHWNGARLVG